MKPHWKVILATLGVILPSVFTYLASRSDSNEAKIRAEVAYVTMQETVKELQETSYAQAIELAEIRGQLKGGRVSPPQASAPKPFLGPVRPKPEPGDAADGDGLMDPPAPAPTSARPKPPSFNDAVQSYKAKK